MNEKTFDSALKELEEIIKKLESGGTPLEEAITAYKDAMNLVKICQEKLDNATSQVNKILNENGTISDFQSEVSDTNE